MAPAWPRAPASRARGRWRARRAPGGSGRECGAWGRARAWPRSPSAAPAQRARPGGPGAPAHRAVRAVRACRLACHSPGACRRRQGSSRSSRSTTTPGAVGRFGRTAGSIPSAGPSSIRVPIPSAAPPITTASTSPSATTGPSAAHLPAARTVSTRSRRACSSPRPSESADPRAGHFGYGHIDAVVLTGERSTPGQHIGWTCKDDWHVHLSEFASRRTAAA